MINSNVEVITPEIAKILLEKNNINRKVSEKQVLFYASQMKKGEWEETGEGISIANDGTIIDGQHRLLAICKSGIPLNMLVVRNVPKKSFSVYDTGKTRSFSDIFKIDGIPNSNNASSIITSYYKWNNNLQGGNNVGESTKKLSKKQALILYHKHSETVQYMVNLARRLYIKSKLLPISTIGGVALYMYIEKKHDIENIESFFYQLMTGDNIENETILIFRNKLIKDLSSRYKMTIKIKNILLTKTWNAYVQGIEIKKIKFDIKRESIPDFL